MKTVWLMKINGDYEKIKALEAFLDSHEQELKDLGVEGVTTWPYPISNEYTEPEDVVKWQKMGVESLSNQAMDYVEFQ